MMSCISSVLTYDTYGGGGADGNHSVCSSAPSSYHPPDYDSDCNSIYSGYNKRNKSQYDDDDEEENDTMRVAITLRRRQDSRLVADSKRECGLWRRNQHRQEQHQSMSRAVAAASESDQNKPQKATSPALQHTCCGEYCFHTRQAQSASVNNRSGCRFCKNCHACIQKERQEKERMALDKQRVGCLLQQTQSYELQKLLTCWMEGQPRTPYGWLQQQGDEDVIPDDNMNDVRERLRDFGGGERSLPEQEMDHRHHRPMKPQHKEREMQRQKQKRKRRILTCSTNTTTNSTISSSTSKARQMIKKMKMTKNRQQQQKKKNPKQQQPQVLQKGHFQQKKKGSPPKLIVLDYAARTPNFGASDYVPPPNNGHFHHTNDNFNEYVPPPGFLGPLAGQERRMRSGPSSSWNHHENEYVPPGFGGFGDFSGYPQDNGDHATLDATFDATLLEEESERYYNHHSHQRQTRRKRKDNQCFVQVQDPDLKVQRKSSYLGFLFCGRRGYQCNV